MSRNQHELLQEIDRLRRGCASRADGNNFDLGVRWTADQQRVEYLYRQGQLICEQADSDQVIDAFDRIGADRPTSVSEGPVGLAVLDIGDRDAAELADQVAEPLGDESVATVNHVLDAQGFGALCPATEPVPASGPVSVLPEPTGPGRARIAVVDTGYLDSIAEQSGFERFAAVTGRSEMDDEVYVGGSDGILPYGGHGTASTARLLAVAGSVSTAVQVRDCLLRGAVDELTIVDDLERVVRQGVDVISLQAGLYACRGHSPKGFNAFRRRVLSQHPETVIVAAAGNHGADVPFWPAAYGWTTAVGALTHGGNVRTGWSNFGHWVDVFALGENVLVPFPNGTYTYLDDTSAPFTNGHALWSGTSFAAPVVAGMIARRMIERGVDAPTARDIVLREAAVAALPTTGPRLVV